MPQTKLLDSRSFNIVLAFIVLAVWGFAFVFIRIAVREVPPMSLAFLRFVVGLAVLYAIPAPRPASVSRGENRRIILMGLFGVSLYFIFENWALVFTTATNASILVSIIPVLTLIGAVVFFRERFTVWNALGAVISFVASALVVWNGKVNFHLNPLGDALMLVASAAWAVYTLLSRGILEKMSPLYVSRRMILYGCIFLLPFFLYELATGQVRGTSPFSIFAILYLGVLCSAMSYVLWNQVLRALGVVFTSNLIYLQCVFAILAAQAAQNIFPAFVTIREPITWLLVGFTAMLFLGVALANLHARNGGAPRAGH